MEIMLLNDSLDTGSIYDIFVKCHQEDVARIVIILYIYHDLFCY